MTDQNGCSGEGNLIVDIEYSPIFDLGNDTSGVSSMVLDVGVSGLQYLWSTGETTQQIVVDSSGLYQVWVTGANGCTSADEIFVEILPAGITENLSPDFIKIYPNPFQDQITVDLELVKNQEFSLAVFDLSGKKVLYQSFGQLSGSIKKVANLQDLSEGAYFLAIQLDEAIHYYKILKQ